MPDTRPGIKFNEEGVCSACVAYEERSTIDWDKRHKELEALCDKYRGSNGTKWDCAIAVSGGKDSHFQVHYMKEVMGMNPVLITAQDNFPMTKAGINNVRNISEEFGCQIIALKPDIKTEKAIMRYMFEKYGRPSWVNERYTYCFPLHMSIALNIPFLVYGENASREYGGEYGEDTYSARNQILNGIALEYPMEELMSIEGIDIHSLEYLKSPSKDELNKIDPMYLSYFVPWNSYSNYLYSKSRGFHDLTGEWDRQHHIENYDQIDSRLYLVHSWMKYPKYGHGSATDYAARYIRYGLMDREEGKQSVKLRDHALDPACVADFCEFLGYTESEFWKIVDRFYNQELFTKDSYGKWILKHPVWES